MDEGILSIRWETGSMDICMEAFFPCEMARFRKLLKVIDLDWKNCDTLKETLKVYFQQQIPALKEQRVKLAVDLAHAKQAVTDLERMVKSRKKAGWGISDQTGISTGKGRFESGQGSPGGD